MANSINSRNNRRGKQKRLPIFSIILVALFVLVPAAFFYVGMRDSPGRTPPPADTQISDFDEEDDGEHKVYNPVLMEPTPAPLPPAVEVKGIYYIVEFSSLNNFNQFLDFIDETSLNAIVLDVKDDFGGVSLQTDNAVLQNASNAYRERTPNAIQISSETIDEINSRGIYPIARVVCFSDNRYAIENPENALQSIHGGAWRYGMYNNNFWLDPHNRDNWEYILEVCKEAARIGFKEIQLDYVRYPSEGRLSEIDYGEDTEEQNKYHTINEFMLYIREEMRMLGVRTSADIFGIVGMSYEDASGVGQNVELLFGSLDSICPMIYPSHFSNSGTGYFGNGVGQNINGVLFTHPDAEPYGVIYNILQHFQRQRDAFMEHTPGVEPAIVRPYLQYFTADFLDEEYYIEYGPEEIAAQVQAVYDAGFNEWLLWTRNNSSDPARLALVP